MGLLSLCNQLLTYVLTNSSIRAKQHIGPYQADCVGQLYHDLATPLMTFGGNTTNHIDEAA